MKNLLFYGGGNISFAVIKGLIKSGYKKENIFYCDRNTSNQKKLKALKIKNINKTKSVNIDYIILAVKPKDALEAFHEIVNKYNSPKIVSFVAGIKTKKYKQETKLDFSLIRAMPNTSSKFGLGITAIYNLSFNKSHKNNVKNIFNKIGLVIEIDKESKIDVFTGLIGSGPAYFFYLLKSYEKKLSKIFNGDEKKIKKTISYLMMGVGKSIEESNDIDKLIQAVASKKGTTEAGIKSFRLQKLNKSFDKGLDAAIKRSKEISDEY
ncbi:MAG: hypothetical protein CMD80_02885 [Gammaproteobacteria bacterium]|nr:hypothetical protein [Gammaproteobacteria bacterium]